MEESVESPTSRVIRAWAADVEADPKAFSFNAEYLQNEAVALACSWSLANALEGQRASTPFAFASDFMHDSQAPSFWEQKARAQGDWLQDITQFPYRRLVDDVRDAGVMSPQAYELFALTSGHPVDREFISGVEASLLSSLAHAAYNSASGIPYIILDPLGPSPLENQTGFLRYTGPTLTLLVKDILSKD